MRKQSPCLNHDPCIDECRKHHAVQADVECPLSSMVVAGTLKHAHLVQRPSEHQEDQGEGVDIVHGAVDALHGKYDAG